MSEAIDPVASLLSVLDLRDAGARTTEDIFTGVSQPMPTGRVYGGQVLAQTIVAASRTLPPERSVHSMHGYFLRPGDPADGITFSVDRIHDGRSFSTRRTQAFQSGVPIFSMIASFQDEDPGLEHFEPMPDGIPQPEDAPVLDVEALHPISRRIFSESPVDVRHVTSPLYASVEGPHVPRQAVWMRLRRPITDDPRCTAPPSPTSATSRSRSRSCARTASRGTPPGSRSPASTTPCGGIVPAVSTTGSCTCRSHPTRGRRRGLATGRIYARDGALLASVAQEVMVRVPRD